jgi:gas vesicle protein
MKGFVLGILFGIGVGLLFAPMPGGQARRILEGLSVSELVGQYAQQIFSALSQSSTSVGNLTQFSVGQLIEEKGSTFKSLAELVVNKVMENGSVINNLGNILNQVVSDTRAS